MSAQTKISWCDSTVNLWIGCTKVSEGCKNCYADEQDQRRFSRTLGGGTKENPIRHFGPGAPRYKVKDAVKNCIAWNKRPWVCDCEKSAGTEDGKRFFSRDIILDEEEQRYSAPVCCECGNLCHRRRVFVNSLSDWLDPEVPIEWLAELLDTIHKCQELQFILCTKRPENFMPRMYEICRELYNVVGYSHMEYVGDWMNGEPLKNVILLTTVENQEQADKRIPELLKIPAVCRGLSIEPLLEEINFRWAKWDDNKPNTRRLNQVSPVTQCGKILAGSIEQLDGLRVLDWVIVGGESGKNARPCNVEWIRSIVSQCKAENVLVFVKQASGLKSGTQGEIPDAIFNIKEFPLINQ